MSDSDVSPFEIIHSGLVEKLLTYITVSDPQLRDLRLRKFLHVFLGCPVSTLKPALKGYWKLQWKINIRKCEVALQERDETNVKAQYFQKDIILKSSLTNQVAKNLVRLNIFDKKNYGNLVTILWSHWCSQCFGHWITQLLVLMCDIVVGAWSNVS